MPLIRYFLIAGGALLGLLFLADWRFPSTMREASGDEIDRTIIRIHSARVLPAAVNFDTSMPMPTPIPKPPAAVASAAEPAKTADTPPSAGEAYAYLPPRGSEREVQARRNIRSTARRHVRTTHRRFASSQPNWFAAW
jgi:hypothetical protein